VRRLRQPVPARGPFGYDGEATDHWYAWDIDSCWLLTVVGAGVFGSAQDALAEWQHAVGPAAGTALSPSTPKAAARLLAPCLATGPLSDMLEGSEPRELIREYYRLRRRAHVLTGSAGATAASATAASSGGGDPGPVREAFLGWYEARYDDVPQDVAKVVYTILDEWGPRAHPGDRSLYACSPHRIEMAARLIRDGYFPDHANAAPHLLPEWTQWCIGQSGLNGDFAARSRAAIGIAFPRKRRPTSCATGPGPPGADRFHRIRPNGPDLTRGPDGDGRHRT
jgi:hypothetical protein